MFLLLTGWFIVTFHFVLRVQSLINRLFNTVGHNLKRAESLIPRDILFLKNIDDLVGEFKGLAVKYLGFNEADLFLSGTDDGFFDNRRGRSLTLTTDMRSWLMDYNHMIDCHMVGTHPRFEKVRNDLLGLLSGQSAQFMVPLVQHGTLLGLAFFKDVAPNRLMLRDEIRFVDRLAEIASIALFNSMVFEAISDLKNQLEDKTLKLSEEIAERKKAEAEIIRSRERYKLLADNVKDTIWVLRVDDLSFTYMSPSVTHLLGYTVDEMLNMKLDQILTPESMDYVRKLRDGIVASGRLVDDDTLTLTLELEHIRKDGTRVWAEVSTHALNNGAHPLRMIGVSRDITERKKAQIEKQALESRLAQAQKMESIGVLAGGIAHDFNNILMAILGYTQLARIYIPEDNTAAHEKLARIEKASNRAKGMVAQILAFSRQGSTTKLSVQMGPIVKEAMNLLKASLPSTISLAADFEDNVPSVMADPVQIHQVVINLCSNAAHAMETEGGECRISLSPYHLTKEEASSLNLPSGLYARLSVSDTGQGMDRKILDKIFDPYFTTKEVGKGTGMGLAVVHGIITGCGGRIRVDSALGKGTRFDLLFPAAESPVKNPVDQEDVREIRGQERVLFVDDEKDIRDFAQECLGSLGFQVTTAEDGRAALDLVKAGQETIDIVVTDLTMPHMSGEQLAAEIHLIRPDLPVILCTGYNTYLPEHHADHSGITDILIKPVPGKDLAEAIRQALDAASPSA
jgi:PAS domain S-box-containing protein